MPANREAAGEKQPWETGGDHLAMRDPFEPGMAAVALACLLSSVASVGCGSESQGNPGGTPGPDGGGAALLDAPPLDAPLGEDLPAAGGAPGTDGATGTSGPGTLAVLAGVLSGYGSTDGTGADARFAIPSGVAVDAVGNVFVADPANGTIRKITPAGLVTTVAGGADGSADGMGADARFHFPTGVAVDNAGNLFVADSGNHTIRKITPAGVVTTFAGTAGAVGSTDGTGADARFCTPSAVAVDAAGNVFVADQDNHTIRKITPAAVVTTFAGTASVTGGKVDGTGAEARFYYPQGVAVDGAGNVFVADTRNHTIRMITPASVVTTLAGSGGAEGSTDGTGTEARFSRPQGVAVDGAGNLFVADSGNNTIRMITPASVVTTLSGNAGWTSYLDGAGTAALFDTPTGVAVDAAGSLFVADSQSHTIRKVSPAGAVTTLAGTGSWTGTADGTGAAARFNHPGGAAVDGAGNLFVADSGNHAIRKITPEGVVTTFAGMTGVMGFADGTGADARFYGPTDVDVDASGNLFVADYGNHLVRKISPAGVVSTLAGAVGSYGKVDGLGADARFTRPSGVAVDGAGNVFVAESENFAIRKITPEGVVTTLADPAGLFYHPEDVAADGAGNLFVADKSSHTILKLTPAGVVTTFAGTKGSSGYADGTGADARFSYPQAVAVDGAGNVLVAELGNRTIRKITPAGEVSTIAGSPTPIPAGTPPGPLATFLPNPLGVAADRSTGNLYITVDSAVMVAGR
jgi:sugar lactone lactonase YvrE